MTRTVICDVCGRVMAEPYIHVATKRQAVAREATVCSAACLRLLPDPLAGSEVAR